MDKRVNNEIHKIRNINTQVIESEEAPAGCIVEHSFTLKQEHEYDVCLAFYTIHQYIRVSIGGEEVYHLQQSEQLDTINTPGTNWTLIPLYESDVGKEIKVELTPAYESIMTTDTEFVIGQETEIIVKTLSKHLPSLMISGLAIVLGCIILVLAIYLMWKDKRMNELLPLGIFSILLGMWRFTDTGFSPFLNPDKPVFMFYTSVLALIVGVIPMIKSQKSGTKGKVVNVYCLSIGIVSIIVMIMDMAGSIDIREILKGLHVILFIGVLLMVYSLIKAQKSKDLQSSDAIDRVAIWILIAGIIGDALVFYITGTSAELFFTLAAFLVLILLKGIGFIYAYLITERALVQREKQLINSRATAMMGQIRSHFVFNILNAISGMCKYDPEKADDTVVRFSRYLRANVDIMGNDEPVMFNVALSRIEDYVALEQVRFGDKIKFVKSIETEDFKIPALILQPIIENAIKHGILPKKDGGTIIIKTYYENDDIIIKIIDDGVGYDTEAAARDGSAGMKNVRFRLDYFLKGKLSIDSEIDKGTEATITIPRKESGI